MTLVVLLLLLVVLFAWAIVGMVRVAIYAMALIGAVVFGAIVLLGALWPKATPRSSSRS